MLLFVFERRLLMLAWGSGTLTLVVGSVLWITSNHHLPCVRAIHPTTTTTEISDLTCVLYSGMTENGVLYCISHWGEDSPQISFLQASHSWTEAQKRYFISWLMSFTLMQSSDENTGTAFVHLSANVICSAQLYCWTLLHSSFDSNSHHI